MGNPQEPFRYNELIEKTKDELIEIIDDIIGRGASVAQYLKVNECINEIDRREQKEHDKLMRKLTGWITAMTAVMMVATIVNVVLFYLK